MNDLVSIRVEYAFPNSHREMRIESARIINVPNNSPPIASIQISNSSPDRDVTAIAVAVKNHCDF